MVKQAERDRTSLASAIKVICNSQYLADQLAREGLSPEALEVVYPGCALLMPEMEKLPKRPRSPRPTISFAGRIVYAKGLHLLLNAIAESGVQLEVAGEGWQASRLKTLSGSNVSWRGYVNHLQIHKMHSSAWVSALPSIWPEPFGMTGIEALACGTPVIAFRVGGISEWLIPEVGALVDVDERLTPERLEAALSQYLTSAPSEALAHACREHARRLCGLSAFGDRIDRLLGQVA